MCRYRCHHCRIRCWIRLAIAIAVGLLFLTAAGLVIDVGSNPTPAGSTNPPPVPTPPWGASSLPTAHSPAEGGWRT